MRRAIASLVLVGAVVLASVLVVSLTDIADHESVLVASLAALAVAVVNHSQIRQTRDEVRTSNGDSMGKLVDSISDRMFHHEVKLDGLETELRELRTQTAEGQQELKEVLIDHIVEAAPLAEFVRTLMPRKEEE